MSEASPATRRFVALVLVAAIHVLIFMLARSPTGWRSHDSQSHQSSSVLLFPEITPTPREPLPIDIRPRLDPSQDISVADFPRLAPTAPSDVAADVEAKTPSTDWNLEAARAAAAVVDEAVRREKRKCEPSDTANSFLPKCQQEPPPKFDWAPPSAGFAGGLPYVLVGENCIVGLGFFGCMLGKQSANGHLLDHMRDPERDRSSVPASN